MAQNVEWNELTEQTLDNFTDQSSLNLRNHRLFFIEPNSFDNHSHFEQIDLSENAIGSLPEHIFANLHQLKILRLDFNLFAKVQSIEYSRIRNLRELNLSHNLISELNEPFLRSESLISLDLSHNRLVELPEPVFASVPNLASLNLGFNRLHRLASQLFEHNYELKYLFLNNNRLQELPRNLFASLPHLKQVNLSCNLFSGFYFQQFHFNLELMALNLYENPIPFLSPTLFIPLTNLVQLKLYVIRTFYFSSLLPLRQLQVIDVTVNSIESFNLATNYNRRYFVNKLQLKEFSVTARRLRPTKTLFFPFSPQTIRVLYVRSLEMVGGQAKSFNFVRQMNQTPNLRVLVLHGIDKLLIFNWNMTSNVPIWYQLAHFDVGGSKLSVNCPIIQRQFCRLKHLNLAKCNFQLELRNAFVYLEQLEFLSLEGVRVFTVFRAMFVSNCRLEILVLEDCSIVKIEDYAFRSLCSLKVLNLKHNPIRRLSNRTFFGLDRSQTAIQL